MTEEEFTEAFLEIQSHLRARAYAYLGSVEDAEDAVQTAFLQCFKAVKTGAYHERGQFKSWMSTVVHNVSFTELRKSQYNRKYLHNRPKSFVEISDDAQYADVMSMDDARLVDMFDKVNLVNGLSDKSRLILVLAASGYSGSEIADRMHMSIDAVRVFIYRSRQRLDAMAAKQGPVFSHGKRSLITGAKRKAVHIGT